MLVGHLDGCHLRSRCVHGLMFKQNVVLESLLALHATDCTSNCLLGQTRPKYPEGKERRRAVWLSTKKLAMYRLRPVLREISARGWGTSSSKHLPDKLSDPPTRCMPLRVPRQARVHRIDAASPCPRPLSAGPESEAAIRSLHAGKRNFGGWRKGQGD